VDKAYVLDTSALIAYIESEKGADKVEELLLAGKKNRCRLFVSFISLMEIYYIAWQERGEDAAKEVVMLVKSLSIEVVDSHDRLTLCAGRIKANHRLSLADALVAATAMEKDAILVHKDPEFEQVKQLQLLTLPYK